MKNCEKVRWNKEHVDLFLVYTIPSVGFHQYTHSRYHQVFPYPRKTKILVEKYLTAGEQEKCSSRIYTVCFKSCTVKHTVVVQSGKEFQDIRKHCHLPWKQMLHVIQRATVLFGLLGLIKNQDAQFPFDCSVSFTAGMTVSYTHLSHTASWIGGLSRLLFLWRGSLFKGHSIFTKLHLNSLNKLTRQIIPEDSSMILNTITGDLGRLSFLLFCLLLPQPFI